MTTHQTEKMQIILVLTLVVVISDYSDAGGHNIGCTENLKCVPITRCRSHSDIVYPCNENHVCCSPEKIIERNISSVVLDTSAFPNSCGISADNDRFLGGTLATMGQFPWMALLGYKERRLDPVQFLCGGSLITQEYVLTAAHCIDVPRTLVIVRLGELNLETDEDSDLQGNYADPHRDILVDKTISHENYNKQTLENDIALVKLKHQIIFTEFVSPICLPLKEDIDYEIKVNDRFFVSGWGKTISTNVCGSSQLEYARVTVWDQVRCNMSIPPTVRPIRDWQFCASGMKTENCKGDSGGPLANFAAIDDDVRFFQTGIVSVPTCDNPDLPIVATTVEYYINWIVNNVV